VRLRGISAGANCKNSCRDLHGGAAPLPAGGGASKRRGCGGGGVTSPVARHPSTNQTLVSHPSRSCGSLSRFQEMNFVRFRLLRPSECQFHPIELDLCQFSPLIGAAVAAGATVAHASINTDLKLARNWSTILRISLIGFPVIMLLRFLGS